MTLKNKDFRLVVDYYSKYVELPLLSDKTASKLSHHIPKVDIRQTRHTGRSCLRQHALCKQKNNGARQGLGFQGYHYQPGVPPVQLPNGTQRTVDEAAATQMPSRRIGSLSRPPQLQKHAYPRAQSITDSASHELCDQNQATHDEHAIATKTHTGCLKEPA